MYTIDFETRSCFDLRRGGLFKYARHFSTEILCLAFKKDDMPAQLWLYTDGATAEITAFLDDVQNGATCEAHNAEFEYQLWNNVGVRLHNWPALSPNQIRCSLARASMVGLPKGLGALAAALNAPIQKDAEGAKLMLKMCKPCTKTGTFLETPEMLARLGKYCKTDVDAEHSCGRLLPELPPVEQRLWALTATMNDRGLLLDVPKCQAAIRLLAENDRHLHREVKRITKGACRTGRQVAAMLNVLASMGVELAKLDKEHVEAALDDFDTPDIARELLLARLEIAKASVRKYDAMIDICGDDNRMRGTLRYHAAATGRWAGQKLQPQNFYRPTVKDTKPILRALDEAARGKMSYAAFKARFVNVGEALANTLRNMIVAPEGKTFLNGDYSAIEARVLAWLAEEEDTLEAYRQGVDTYKAMASKVYGCDVQDVTPDQRQFGKAIELGCGFGMGVDKFFDTCKKQGQSVSKTLAENAVETYRAAHKDIVRFWYALGNAAIAAANTPGTVFECEKLKLFYDGRFLKIKLPSGRRLFYYNPAVVIVEHKKFGKRPVLSYDCEYQGRLVREATYGGKLAENVTQAVARDIMASAMLRLESAGFMCVLTVHDEIMAEVEAVDVDRKMKAFVDAMQFVPKWAAGMPLKVGSWSGQYYRK